MFNCEQSAIECTCAMPNINESLSITLDFKNYSDDDLSLIKIIQLDKASNSPIDTLIYESPVARKIYMGGGHEMISFGELGDSDELEEVKLNYIIQITNIEKNVSLSDIEVKKIESDCCDFFEITTLNLDSDVRIFNSSQVILEL